MAPARRRSSGRSSIVDVARRAGVSIGTVSNVLNRPDLVSAATRKHVERAVAELRFVPNKSAQQLRGGGSRSIGLVVHDHDNPFFTEVASGIEEVADRAGYLVILCSSRESPDRESRYLRMLEEHRVRGVLITPVDEDVRRLEELRRHGTNVVLLDHPSPLPDLCSVAVDDVRGGELATRHLIELGHRRIGFVNGPASIRQCAERRQGVRRAAAAAGLVFGRDVVEIAAPALTAPHGESAVEQVVARRLTGVFCANDVLASGVLRGAVAHGLAVPRDLAVVGYDDIRFAAVLHPPLSSVRQPKQQLGRTAAELLLEEANDGASHEHRQVTFTPELVVRGSSAPPARARRRPPAKSAARTKTR